MEKTGYSCPSCKKQTGDTNEVFIHGGRLRCSKVMEHQWVDVVEFYALKPTIDFQMEQPKPTTQQGHTPLTVNVPVRVKNAIQSKYAEKADATVGGVLAMMAEGEVLVISETDLQRLNSQLPERPKNGSHLFGMIVALRAELDEAKQAADAAAKDLKAYEGMSVGRVLIDLGAQYQNAKQRAEAETLPLKEFVQRAVVGGLENNWF